MICYAKLNLAVNLSLLQQQVGRMLHNQLWTPHLNTAHYQGDWNILPLRTPGGSIDKPFPELMGGDSFANTPIMTMLPEIAVTLNNLACEKLSARLLNLKAGAIIKEHKDADLAFEKGEARLHIPIFTNNRVEFYVEDERVTMKEGECWYMNANLPHRVANYGETDRIHLVIDCVVNNWLKTVFEQAEQKTRPEVKDRAMQLQIINALRLQQNDTATTLANQLERELES